MAAVEIKKIEYAAANFADTIPKRLTGAVSVNWSVLFFFSSEKSRIVKSGTVTISTKNISENIVAKSALPSVGVELIRVNR